MMLTRRSAETGYLDILRVYACLAVIIFHVFSSVLYSFSSSLSEFETYICVVLRNIWLWHVPVFVMISGVLFLNKEKEIALLKLYKKYIIRILLALVIFGFPFALMELLFDTGYRISIGQIGTAGLHVLQNKLWDHMWYLYMITGLYMLLPLFKVFVNYAGKKLLEYVLIVLFVFTSVIPAFQNMVPFRFGIYIPIGSVFVFYLLFGHYIHQYDIHVKNGFLCLMGSLYFLYVITIPINRNFIIDGSGIVGLYGNISPLVIMITLCVFCFIRQNASANRVHEFVATQTFGMYLIHPLFIHMLFKLIKFNPEKYPLAAVISCAVIVTILSSLLFSIIARKVNIIKKYVL